MSTPANGEKSADAGVQISSSATASSPDESTPTVSKRVNDNKKPKRSLAEELSSDRLSVKRVSELQKLCKKHGLKATGKKEHLVELLVKVGKGEEISEADKAAPPQKKGGRKRKASPSKKTTETQDQPEATGSQQTEKEQTKVEKSDDTDLGNKEEKAENNETAEPASKKSKMDDHLYPLDAHRKLIAESVDEEGFTVREFEVEKNGETTHIKVRTKYPSEHKPEPHDPIYPLDANRELVNTTTDEDGYTVKTFQVTKNDQQSLVTVRIKLPTSSAKDA